jgi:hypothetical protein
MPHNDFFADRSNEGLKSIGLNFSGANWVVFFTVTKTQMRKFYRD